MPRYGQTLFAWGTVNAPHLYTGSCTSYSQRDALTRKLIDDENGDWMAAILEGHKAALNFDGKVTVASVDFLDLSTGAGLVVPGITTGTVLAFDATEKWVLEQPKTASVEATYYPDVVQASPVLAGIENTAFTPDQSALGTVAPGTKIIYGTDGLTFAAGTVQGLTLKQQLTLSEDELTPDGKILGVNSHGYMRTLTLDILAIGAIPVVGTSLAAITGGTSMMTGFMVESAELKYRDKRGALYQVGAFWIPPFAS